MGFLDQMYLTNDLMNWADWLNDFCMLIVMEWFLVWWSICSVSLNYVDCIPFSCNDSFHMAHNQSKWFKKILFWNFWQTWWSNLYLCGRGPVKSILFICPSVCPSVRLRCIFFRIYSVDFFDFFPWGYFAIYTEKWQSGNLKNCIV